MPFDLTVSLEDLRSGRYEPIIEARKGTTVAATDVNIDRPVVDPDYIEYYGTVSVFYQGATTCEVLIGLYDGINFHVFAENDSLAADDYLVLARGFFVREGHKFRVQIKSATADEVVTVYINGARLKVR